MNDLEKCPFCGSDAEYVTTGGYQRMFAVSCSNTVNAATDNGDTICRCATPFFITREQARDVWNRRVQ